MQAATGDAELNRDQVRARSAIRRQRTLRGRDHRIVAEERSRRIRESVSASTESQPLLRAVRLPNTDSITGDDSSRRRSVRANNNETANPRRASGLIRTPSAHRTGDVTFSNPGDDWLHNDDPLRMPLRSPTPPPNTRLLNWADRYVSGRESQRQEASARELVNAGLRQLGAELPNRYENGVSPFLSSRSPNPSWPLPMPWPLHRSTNEVSEI